MSRDATIGFKVNREEEARIRRAAQEESNGNISEFCRTTILAYIEARETSHPTLQQLEDLAKEMNKKVQDLRHIHDAEFADIIRTRAKLQEMLEGSDARPW